MTLEEKTACYQALMINKVIRNGITYMGVTTTGIFCRSVCPARRPNIENCEFFQTIEQVVKAGFRPCKRCRPVSHPDVISAVVRPFVEAIEAEPDKTWTPAELRKIAPDFIAAQHTFKEHFGLTLAAYAKLRGEAALAKAQKHRKSGL